VAAVPRLAALAGKLPPLGRVGQVSEVVDGIVYLESAPFVTGEVLHIDGGRTAGTELPNADYSRRAKMDGDAQVRARIMGHWQASERAALAEQMPGRSG
jgi:ribosomal protein L10